MTEEQIFRRMLLHLSGIDFRSFVFGSQSQQIVHGGEGTAYFNLEELKNIEKAKNTLREFGTRLQIIDQSTCPYMDARAAITYVETLKEQAHCTRAIVVIDYLQVWPANTSIRFPSENEADKWRIGEMKKIREIREL